MISDRRSPNVQLLRLARLLRSLRAGQGRTAAEVAAELGWSERRLLRLETAEGSKPQVGVVDRLLALYEVDGQRREDILQLVIKARRRGWWQDPELHIAEGHAALIGFEAEARVIRGLELGLIPGLFQTRAYATALIAGRPSGIDDAETRRLVEVRMIRQERLAMDGPFVDLILGEAALHWTVGGRQVMTEQLEHLTKLAHDPKITIRVLPFEAGHMAGLPPFTVLTLLDPLDPEYLYVEDAEGGSWSDELDRVTQYTYMWERLIGATLPTDGSITKINQLVAHYARE